MAKCLVLGGNGFIGSHLVDSLVEAGHEVRAFDRFSNEQTTRYNTSPKVEQFAGDFLNMSDLRSSLEGMDYVFHFISTTTPASAENDPLVDIDTNIGVSIKLFQLCVEMKIKKVIYASTGGAIYGPTDAVPINEEVTPHPISPYAIGKLTIEHYLRYFKAKWNLDSLIFRISNPYGERQPLHNKQGVIPIFLHQILNGEEPLTVFGDGSMVRDYIYVKDVARMITDSFEGATKRVYNLGSGEGVSVSEVVDRIETVVGRQVSVEHKPKPVTFVDRVVLDVSRFRDEFGVMPTVPLDEGIKRTWEYVKQQEKQQ